MWIFSELYARNRDERNEAPSSDNSSERTVFCHSRGSQKNSEDKKFAQKRRKGKTDNVTPDDYHVAAAR